jgi:hypothetical protein
MLTANRASGRIHRVLWWDLAAHTLGVGTLPNHSSWKGSSPSGWVLTEGSDLNNRTIAVESTGGVVTDNNDVQFAGFTAFGAFTGETLHHHHIVALASATSRARLLVSTPK